MWSLRHPEKTNASGRRNRAVDCPLPLSVMKLHGNKLMPWRIQIAPIKISSAPRTPPAIRFNTPERRNGRTYSCRTVAQPGRVVGVAEIEAYRVSRQLEDRRRLPNTSATTSDLILFRFPTFRVADLRTVTRHQQGWSGARTSVLSLKVQSG